MAVFGSPIAFFHQACTQTACHHPTRRVLSYVSCCSVTWVFQNSSDLENMATGGTRSPCSLDSTPFLWEASGPLKAICSCPLTGEGYVLAEYMGGMGLEPTFSWMLGWCMFFPDGLSLLPLILPAISSFYLSTSRLEDSCCWWWW